MTSSRKKALQGQKKARQERVASSSISSSSSSGDIQRVACLPPARQHRRSYHEPLLLYPELYRADLPTVKDEGNLGPRIGQELLDWYARVAEVRGMPWRQAWVSPFDERYTSSEEGQVQLRKLLERRAYEVWISEIMLQQTRVATVISYWNAWTSRWPTIQALAAASPEDVLSAWKGLGYYSRATRIHQAAQSIVADQDLKGLLPSTAAELQKKVAGVGPYTAGAISSIVFGRAEAILDGNVSRVLSRQLGLYSNPKNKSTTDLLWKVTQRMVEAVAGFTKDEEVQRSPIPGLWNQALMELGSTICTPTPKCGDCPIRSTCRAYAEGEGLALQQGLLGKTQCIHPIPETPDEETTVRDIEDLCELCEPFPMSQVTGLPTLSSDKDGAADQVLDSSNAAINCKRKNDAMDVASSVKKKKKKPESQQSSLLNHFVVKKTKTEGTKTVDGINPETEIVYATTQNQSLLSPKALDVIYSHVKEFPLKVTKAKVREEECLVCIIEIHHPTRKDRHYLMEQRPDKGLLASLWEFPTLTLAQVDDDENDDDDDNSHDDEDDEEQRKKRKNLNSSQSRKIQSQSAMKFVKTLLKPDQATRMIHRGQVGSLVHVFSHLKLMMNVHHFTLDLSNDESFDGLLTRQGGRSEKRKWCTRVEVEEESMGTGMKRCWELLMAQRKSDAGTSSRQKKVD